ncbi:MAG: hypothetical protein Q4F05_05910 [bacterium]|nr:hypothetical protein [bacterium]
MKIEEKLSWIADGPWRMDDYTESLEFVHSFGLKCDCVGWTTINIQSEKDLELLEQIREKADKEHIFLRAYYEKKISEIETDWYILKPKVLQDVEGADLNTIKGYKVPKGCHIFNFSNTLPGVSEKFIKACKQNNLTGATFSWLPDTARYQALPYYNLIPEQMISRIAGETESFRKYSYRFHGIDKNTKRERYRKKGYNREELLKLYSQADSSGGHLTFLESIIDNYDYVDIPIMIDEKGVPDTDFAYLAHERRFEILIRKSATVKLIATGVLAEKDLVPVSYFDEKKNSLMIMECETKQFSMLKSAEELFQLQEEWKKKKYPVYIPTEKITLKALRQAKKENKEFYHKPLKKVIAESLIGTELESMLPYYRISDGGFISDEIEYYAFENVEIKTKEFLTEIKNEEELLEEMPQLLNCNVIGHAINGDHILLEKMGSVLRYDHEDPTLSIRWDSIFEFFYENIEIS